MKLGNIARAAAFAGLVIACSAGGAGSFEPSSDPAGPFSGQGSPGRSSIDNPGGFIGSGAPGIAGSPDVTGFLTGFCNRVHMTCPATEEAACLGFFQDQWAKLTTDCQRHFYYAYAECLFVRAGVTCTGNDQAKISGCDEPSPSQCGGTTGTTGGTGTGGAGGAGTGGTGGDDPVARRGGEWRHKDRRNSGSCTGEMAAEKGHR